ncbi:MAG: TonB-dependent receptor [Acidobacteria bacterium]|nr:TonB-dependent receptor [Acidobacteriota bacterium]
MNNLNRFRRFASVFVWLGLLVAGLAPTTALAQLTTASISGNVQDESGAVIPGVTVTVNNLDTGISRTLVTDDQGRYHVPQLPLGNYELTATLEGFKTAVRSGIKLTIGRGAVVDLSLELGEITERLLVVGEAPLVQTTDAGISGLVDDKKIRDLPLNGRDIGQLAMLQIGVTNAAIRSNANLSGGLGVKLAINGARFTYNMFLIDGAEANDTFQSPGSVRGGMAGVEALREFEVKTSNYSAEFGRAAGGVINAVLRSGTNEFHGTAYQFHRNDNLDARNFFDPGNPPEFKRNQFGFSVGGPMVRNKAFFFGNYEGLRERLGVTRRFFVPGLDARRGILPGGITVPVAPSVRPYLDSVYPAPNGRSFGDGTAELIKAGSDATDEDFFAVKVDHRLSDADSLFVSYFFDDAQTTLFDLPTFASGITTRNQYATIEEKRVFSPTVLNVFRLSYSRTRPATDLIPTVDVPPNLRFFAGAAQLGNLIVGPLTALRTVIDLLPRDFAQNLFQYSDHVAITKGRHALKMGAELKRSQFNYFQGLTTFGSYEFPTLRALLEGSPTRFGADLPGSSRGRALRQTIFGFYFQDDFRVRSNLTLNLGLRYEPYTVPSDVQGRIATFRDIRTDTNVTVGEPMFLNPSKANFAPRFGLAWDPLGDGKTSLRGGFGLFYNGIKANEIRTSYADLPPFTLNAQISNPPFPNAFDLLARLPQADAARAAIRGTTRPLSFDFKDTYLMHYNLSLQREVAPRLVATAAYTGSRGVHLIRRADRNAFIPQILSDGRKFFPVGLTRPNPALGQTMLFTFDANSLYNALQLSLDKRFSQGIQFQASYTWAKTLDQSSGFFTLDHQANNSLAQDPENLRADRGRADFDVRNSFILNYTYELPFGRGKRFGDGLTGAAAHIVGGWQLNGIVTLADGSPFTAALSFNRARNSDVLILLNDGSGPRPNLVSGRNNDPVLGSPDRWADPSSFELQPAGFYGNLGRNTISGPGFASYDFSLVKDTHLTEAVNLQFRFEAFNLFNRANFSLPSAKLIFTDASGTPAGNFGRITRTTSTSRQVQFVLKLIF